MIKQAYSVQMSFDVPEGDRKIARQASESFEDLIAKLRLSVRHLNLLYVPFSKYQDYDPNEVLKYRAVLRNYRDQVKNNFDEVMERSFRAILQMSTFSADNHTVELMSAFDSQMKDLRKLIDRFLSLFSNIGSQDFIGSLLQSIDSVKKQVAQVKQTINDRILDHIDTNILANNWTSTVTDELQNKVYEKAPLVVELFKERQNAVDGATKD